MKICAFAHRNALEIIRDPITMGFGAGFPLMLLLLFALIQKNVPATVFALDQLVPGIAVFGYSFFALFSALLISRDRSSALMMRLMSSPMRPAQFLAGYALPLIPMAVVQTAICFGAALLLGLQPTIRVLTTMIVLLPAAVMYIAIGFICGCLLDDRQVGGVCGAALTNVSAWLSGTWFDTKLVGGAFDAIAHILPFANAVDAARAALAGDTAAMPVPLAIVLFYAAALSELAIFVFMRKVRR